MRNGGEPVFRSVVIARRAAALAALAVLVLTGHGERHDASGPAAPPPPVTAIR
ncbi:hypothetical protein [Salinispora arenicola]|uniref:Uncharacterized protein n=1 Tax=Salinispora arenicola TaxID=168697 RepID=A0A542XIM8_SALAC|nr:hypothetical protein [Salinispora arenicola]MCN0150609.1 hypothetical protein [Salinispora arenicola]TQL35667.1 hypothetical protein FB564_0731 [Salinispora arenicola]